MWRTIVARILGVMMLTAGAIALFCGIIVGIQTARFHSRARMTEGEIVNFEMRGAKGGPKRHLVYAYRDTTGHLWQSSGSIASQNDTIGKKITVFYDAESPMDSSENPYGRWFSVLFLALWGIGFGSGGWSLIREKTKA